MKDLCEQCMELMDGDVCPECGWKTPERVEHDRARVEELASLNIKPTLVLGDLFGPDGNAFVILSRVDRAMRDLDVPKTVIDEACERMKSGDYVNLLRTAAQFFELDISGYDDVEEFLDAYLHGQPDYADTDVLPKEVKDAYLASLEKALAAMANDNL